MPGSLDALPCCGRRICPFFFFRRERGVVFSFPIFSVTKMEKMNLETIDFSKKKLAYEVDIRFPNFRNDYGTYFNAN